MITLLCTVLLWLMLAYLFVLALVVSPTFRVFVGAALLFGVGMLAMVVSK